MLGIGQSVAVYIARVRALLQDGGLLRMIWGISWSVAGYVAGIMINYLQQLLNAYEVITATIMEVSFKFLFRDSHLGFNYK